MDDMQDIVKKHRNLLKAIEIESQKFRDYYLWLESSMPPLLFEEISHEIIMLITHNLMGLPSQDYFSTIHLKRAAVVLCLDVPDADLKVLENYSMYGVKDYQTFISKSPPPFPGVTQKLRIFTLYFTEVIETVEKAYPLDSREELKALVMERNPEVSSEEFDKLINSINNRFLRALPMDRLILAIDMFFRAKKRDNCQYEVRYNQDWEKTDTNSMQIVFAWRNTPKHGFLHRLARIIRRHNLVMRRVNASYINPYSKDSILLMALNLHGIDNNPVWEAANIPNFLREFVTVKYFASFDYIDKVLVGPGIIVGQMGNFLRAAVNFIHQSLVHVDPNLYTLEHIEKDLCRHPELTAKLCHAFHTKFSVDLHDYDLFLNIRDEFNMELDQLDTGHERNDQRRKNVLKMGMSLVTHTLKTNFFRHNYTSICFRLDPKYLDEIPFKRSSKFPELPYAIYFIKGMHFFGFHIRFKDLSRGGLRTVYLATPEHIESERDHVFTECYHLAYTQQKKNKDIPEGGSKGVIFLNPYERLESETIVLENELKTAKIEPEIIKKKLRMFREEQKLDYLYQAQRSYIKSLLSIINCEPNGRLRAKHVVDYLKRPEYLYLGPDENMHDSMIRWIADFSVTHGYRPGPSFISGKPKFGINHKKYGVTSLGVNVYMHKLLEYLGIDPTTDSFTVKISGGPDGDVAGNQILNLKRYYKDTAKLVALTDVSGTINDPEGLDLDELEKLFHEGKPIKHYPPEKLHDGGFLLDRQAKRSSSTIAQQTLCWRKTDGKVVEDWLPGNEMNHIFRYNVHSTPTDIFIPAGGRPRTLHGKNVSDFLDKEGKPTAKGIVEGANLYLSHDARRALEEKGVLIIKDSSANKAGVICSSFEILSGLSLGEELFLKVKDPLIEEVLERLHVCAANEADLLLRTHKETGEYLTDISDKISDRINKFTYELLNFLDEIHLSDEPTDPLIECFLSYCPPLLAKNYKEQLLKSIPEHHKKAIISSHIGAQLVYKRGLQWYPSIVDILPVLLEHKEIEITHTED